MQDDQAQLLEALAEMEQSSDEISQRALAQKELEKAALKVERWLPQARSWKACA